MVQGGVDGSRLEELGSQLAQTRERLEEIDRAVSALTDAITQLQQVRRSRETLPAVIRLHICPLSLGWVN